MDSSPIDIFQGSEITTILVVSNLKSSKEFYIDTLGGSMYREYGNDSAVIQFLGHWLSLVLPGGPTEDKPGIHFKTPQNIQTISSSFTIRVKDCRHAYTILQTKGVKFLTPPVQRGREVRCFFRDPDGHLLEISEYG